MVQPNSEYGKCNNMTNAIITRIVPPEIPYSGRVVIADNFHLGAAVWQPHPNYPSSALYWQGIYVLSAGKSLCVSDGSGSPVAGTEVYGKRPTGAITSGKVAIEISFSFSNDGHRQPVFHFRQRRVRTAGNLLRATVLWATALWRRQGTKETRAPVCCSEQMAISRPKSSLGRCAKRRANTFREYMAQADFAAQSCSTKFLARVGT